MDPHATNPHLKSFVVHDWLSEQGAQVIKSAKNICVAIYGHPSRGPSDNNPEGVVLSMQKPYAKVDSLLNKDQPTINLGRKAVLRQNFGDEYVCDSKGEDGSKCTYAYGTGCGEVTHGIPAR
jgi:hypothetical protein